MKNQHSSCCVKHVVVFIFLLSAGPYPLLLDVCLSSLHVMSFMQEWRISRPFISLSWAVCLATVKTAFKNDYISEILRICNSADADVGARVSQAPGLRAAQLPESDGCIFLHICVGSVRRCVP